MQPNSLPTSRMRSIWLLSAFLTPSASNHALQKRLRNAMMIRPTTLLSHRASFATNVAAINPAPSTAITPEGLQGLHNFLASGVAARPAATASRMATASAAYRSQTDGQTLPFPFPFRPRPLLTVTDFRRPPLSWLDGRCVQGPGTYSPRHG